jgi:hypothetical protein
MPTRKILLAILAVHGLSSSAQGNDIDGAVRKAVKQSTLNQPGTKPFHLKATIVPTGDTASKRTGEVEIWWKSPTEFKREVRSPEFHQIVITNAGREWQRNKGDYFPEWLRETAVALTEPIPQLDQVREQMKTGEVRSLAGNTYATWMSFSTDGNVRKSIGCTVALNDKTGLLFYGGCLGWGALFKEYKDFHGRSVARILTAGSPEITATVTILEDLKDVAPAFFAVSGNAGDVNPLHTVVVDELTLRKNLDPMAALAWPAVKDGPLEGAITTKIVLDRAGKVRDVSSILSDNPGLSAFASKSIWAMQFKPYLQDGQAVQVVSRITMPFKTVRPDGVDNFASARTYFERGREAGFPAAVARQPYILQATFRAKLTGGAAEEGQYIDTFQRPDEWRREATIGKSHYVRSQHGNQRYELAEGPDVFILRFVLRALEPIPALDTFVEPDWRMKREDFNGTKTVRVLAGYESPEGQLDPEQARGYWFDDSGRLLKTYFKGFETQRTQFEDFGGALVAHRINVLSKGGVAMAIQVMQVSPGQLDSKNNFEMRGHERVRAFTDEVR